MRAFLFFLMLLPACAPAAPPDPQAARLEGGHLAVTLTDGRTCALAVPPGAAFDLDWPGCPGLTAARGGPVVPGQPEILLEPIAEGPLGGAGAPFQVWVWAETGPYLFSR